MHFSLKTIWGNRVLISVGSRKVNWTVVNSCLKDNSSVVSSSVQLHLIPKMTGTHWCIWQCEQWCASIISHFFKLFPDIRPSLYENIRTRLFITTGFWLFLSIQISISLLNCLLSFLSLQISQMNWFSTEVLRFLSSALWSCMSDPVYLLTETCIIPPSDYWNVWK